MDPMLDEFEEFAATLSYDRPRIPIVANRTGEIVETASFDASYWRDHLRNAVYSERPEILTRVPGVGKKTAEKIVFELKDKMVAGLDAAPVMAFDDVNSDVVDALVALGYSIVEAQTAIQALPSDAPKTVEDRIRLALQYFS